MPDEKNNDINSFFLFTAHDILLLTSMYNIEADLYKITA